jgi:hypothetical protein
VSDRLPARTERMGLVFVHRPCGAVIGYATLEPATRGLVCVTCDPMFDGPASQDWRQVFKDDPDAAEILARV